jgi:hypothetical protein
MDYAQYRPATPLDTPLVPIHVLLWSLCLDSSPVANDGLWVKLEQGTAKQWWALQQRQFCEIRTWIVINIDQLKLRKMLMPIHVVILQSFWLHSSPVWQMMACGSNRNEVQQNSGGHCSNRIFVNSEHGL